MAQFFFNQLQTVGSWSTNSFIISNLQNGVSQVPKQNGTQEKPKHLELSGDGELSDRVPL